jgi:hypothetical protein
LVENHPSFSFILRSDPPKDLSHEKRQRKDDVEERKTRGASRPHTDCHANEQV